MPRPAGTVIGPSVQGTGTGLPFGWNCWTPVADAVQAFQRPAFSPPLPSQCQPPAAVYQATQPRVEIGIVDLAVKSGSTRYPGAHCRCPSVQKPFAFAGARPELSSKYTRVS